MEPLAQAIHASAEDPAVFERVFADQFDRLLRRTVRQVFDSEFAVDIAAETLAQAFVQRHKFRGKTDAEAVAWLNGISSRQVANFYRRAAVERRALGKIGIEPPELSEAEHRRVLDTIDAPLLQEALKEALRALSEEQREALTLRIVDEASYRSVAQQLGVSEDVARQRVARGLKKLRKQMGKHQALLEDM